jgi:demethylmenaquinone methyltransferase / 2-methoxy-6-polyprenyl-1,4-benzoquinol methylase
MQNGGETHFGYQSIPLEEKQGRVDDVFHSVARRYDLMNDLMSGGLHRLWKDALVTAVNPPKRTRPFKLLDLAGGTGDVAFRVAEAGGPNTRVAVCDINAEMLAVGADSSPPPPPPPSSAGWTRSLRSSRRTLKNCPMRTAPSIA